MLNGILDNCPGLHNSKSAKSRIACFVSAVCLSIGLQSLNIIGLVDIQQTGVHDGKCAVISIACIGIKVDAHALDDPIVSIGNVILAQIRMPFSHCLHISGAIVNQTNWQPKFICCYSSLSAYNVGPMLLSPKSAANLLNDKGYLIYV